MKLPHTLTLSPQAGKGDMPNATERQAVRERRIPSPPMNGEKVAAAG
ncbi:hypothetical protein GCM10010924_00580 [Rhizobium wenxiniae]|nr:hypothetical protein GCM10010924_00580 [Rhizobium wenxiniae]